MSLSAAEGVDDMGPELPVRFIRKRLLRTARVDIDPGQATNLIMALGAAVTCAAEV